MKLARDKRYLKRFSLRFHLKISDKPIDLKEIQVLVHKLISL